MQLFIESHAAKTVKDIFSHNVILKYIASYVSLVLLMPGHITYKCMHMYLLASVNTIIVSVNAYHLTEGCLCSIYVLTTLCSSENC